MTIKIVPLDVVRKKEAEKRLKAIEELAKEENKVFNGVYMIHNTLHDRKYIGSTKDVNRRIKTHKRELEMGSHNNRFMQKDYNEAGPNLFKYVILEKEIAGNLLTAYEKYYMYIHNSVVMYKGYNQMFPSTEHKLFKQVYESKIEEEKNNVQCKNL